MISYLGAWSISLHVLPGFQFTFPNGGSGQTQGEVKCRPFTSTRTSPSLLLCLFACISILILRRLAKMFSDLFASGVVCSSRHSRLFEQPKKQHKILFSMIMHYEFPQLKVLKPKFAFHDLLLLTFLDVSLNHWKVIINWKDFNWDC